jgi:hypothetical protein
MQRGNAIPQRMWDTCAAWRRGSATGITRGSVVQRGLARGSAVQRGFQGTSSTTGSHGDRSSGVVRDGQHDGDRQYSRTCGGWLCGTGGMAGQRGLWAGGDAPRVLLEARGPAESAGPQLSRARPTHAPPPKAQPITNWSRPQILQMPETTCARIPRACGTASARGCGSRGHVSGAGPTAIRVPRLCGTASAHGTAGYRDLVSGSGLQGESCGPAVLKVCAVSWVDAVLG